MFLFSKYKLLFFTFLLLFCSSCSRNSNSHLQGYIEGEYIYITSSLSGSLIKMNVSRGQEVTQGELLFNLDPAPQIDIAAAAKATIAQLQADLIFDKAKLERQKNLYQKNASDKYSLKQ